MAEGEFNPNFDAYPGAAPGSEKVKETDEQFQERYRQAQAAVKKIRQEEQKKKAQDDSLAKVITKFLGDEGRTPYFILISRLVARDIPSDLILAVIALIYTPAADEIDHKLLQLPAAEPQEQHKEKHALFSIEEKKKIDAWTNGIMRIAQTEPRRVLQTAREVDGQPNRDLIQLFAMVLREFLESGDHGELEIKNLQAFGETFFGTVMTSLQNESGTEYQLEA